MLNTYVGILPRFEIKMLTNRRIKLKESRFWTKSNILRELSALGHVRISNEPSLALYEVHSDHILKVHICLKFIFRLKLTLQS